MSFWGRMNLYKDGIYSENKQDWDTAYLKSAYFRQQHDYMAAGGVWAEALIDVTGGPVYNDIKTHPSIPHLPPIIIP